MGKKVLQKLFLTGLMLILGLQIKYMFKLLIFTFDVIIVFISSVIGKVLSGIFFVLGRIMGKYRKSKSS